MVLILTGLHYDIDAFCHQVLENDKIPMVDGLINWLLQFSPLATTAPTITENFTLVTLTSD